MSIKLPEISFFKPRDSFAVDIGSSSIKIVYLKPENAKFRLIKWGILPIGEAATELSPMDRKNVAAARLAEFMAKEKILTRNVVGSVSGNQVIIRYVRLPKLSREELNKTIQFEAEPYIPFDIREVDLSFHVIGDVIEEGQKKMETILVAAKKEVVQSKLDIFNEAKLRPVVMDVDAFALENAYDLNSDPAVSETVLLISIGASITTMAIIENHISRVVRDVFISGNSFTKVIQRNMACDLKTAEDLKFRHKILVTVEEKEKTLAENQKEALQVSTALTSVAKDLLTEIQRSIDFFISQNPERGIHRVLLSGGSAGLKNLDLFLHQELKMPVELFDPLQNILGAESVPKEVAPQLAIAVGLATRRENDIARK